MKKTFLWLLSLIALFVSSPADAFDGPLRVRNHFPLFLPAHAPCLEKAAVEDSLTTRLSYSSVYLVRDSSAWSVNLDMEIAELALALRKTVHDHLEFGIEVPVLSFNSGVMDDLLG